MSWTNARRSTSGGATSLPTTRRSARGEPPQVPHEQQVLEVRGDGGEVLERLDRLAAALGVAGAQRRGEDLLEQRGLAVGRGPEDAQVASSDPEARELARGAHDFALGLVVGQLPPLLATLDDPEVLELADECGVGTRLLEHSLERVARLGAIADGDRRAAQAPRVGRRRFARLGIGAPGGELLPDHPQRQELVALQTQDRAQSIDLARAVEAVAARRAPRGEQLLVLEVADLRDRDVGELALELLADRPDREGLGRQRRAAAAGALTAVGGRAGARGRRRRAGVPAGGALLPSALGLDVDAGAHRSRKVSLYLPIWSSSPWASLCDSIRRRLM